MKLFECQHCGQPLYFENTRCESCGRDLGYLPSHETITALEEGKRGLRALAERKGRYRYCANCAVRRLQLARLRRQPRAVLRRLPAQPDDPRPHPSPSNLANWKRIETAKHRLFYTLLKLRLPLTDQA